MGTKECLESVSDLRPGQHLCWLYETEEEHRALLTPYLRQGMERSEKVLYIVDAHSPQTVLSYLRDDGMEVDSFLACGQLGILAAGDSYMRTGVFDPDKMIALLGDETERALSEGYTALRVTGEMTWALRDLRGAKRLIEYESKLNAFFPGSKCLAICQYDRRRFRPDLLLDVVSTHPTVVVGTRYYDNFYYTPPVEFLRRNLPAVTLHHWLENLAVRQQAEAALRSNELKFRKLLEAAPVAVVIVDRESRIALVNTQTEIVFGYGREELMGQPVEILVPERFRAQHAEHCSRYFADARAQHMRSDLGMYGRRRDGSEFPIEASLSPIEVGTMALVSAAIRDVTDHKRLEEQLRQSQKMEAVGRLAGGVAHDFNNLLTIITGYSQLLLERLAPDDPLRGNVEAIHKAGERAATLTRQLLAFSRRQLLVPQVLDLNAIVGNVERMLRRLIGEDIELAVTQGQDLGRVKADRGQIEQVILNLALNARDAMPHGGKLTIETANVELDEAYARSHVAVTPGPYVMLAISDTGCGMDAETQAHVFEPFFTTKEQGKGTGLGLATVYGIVKQSGGNIWVYSEPGQGSTFKIYLPHVEAPVAVAGPGQARRAQLRGTETVLLVEDDGELRTLVRGVLESNGYGVLEARHGDDALAVCEQHQGPIHLLLTDVIMPEMSGRDLAEHLTPFHREMKVLYMSGYTNDAIVHHGMLDPGTNFLQKPFSPEALARKVREVLDATSIRDQSRGF